MAKLDLNAPSFFRKGGLTNALGRTEAGRNLDGSFYIEIKGPANARNRMTPAQTYDLAVGLLRALGYELELAPPPGGK